VEWGKEYKLLE